MTRRVQRRTPPRGRTRVNVAARAAAAHRHTDAGPDQIVCLLCGETYRAITYLHLRRIHGFDGAHPILDYKQRFGLRIAMCEETAELLRESKVESNKREGRHWTLERLLGEIRRRARGREPLYYAHVPSKLSLAARRLCGGWEAALRSAGMDPAEHRLTTRRDRATVAEAIRRLAAEGPLTSTGVKEDHSALYRAAIRYWRGWTRSLRAAGVDPRQHRKPKTWTMQRAEAWVRARQDAGESVRSSMVPGGIVAFVARETEGTWVDFVESLGITYPGPRPRLDWSDRSVLTEVRKRNKQGLPMNSRALANDASALRAQAVARFGSWDGALRRAGIDPTRVRLKRTWERADVVAAIRERRRRGLALNAGAVNREFVALARQASQHFGSWDAALKAAGIDAARIRLSRTWSSDGVLTAIRDRHRRGRAMDRAAALRDEPRLVDAVRRVLAVPWSEALPLAGLGTGSRPRATQGGSGVPGGTRRHPRPRS